MTDATTLPAASPRTDIDEEVLILLKSHKGDWKRVAEGSGVSYSWIVKFANGRIGDETKGGGPTVGQLRKLRTWLEANPPSASAPADSQPGGPLVPSP